MLTLVYWNIKRVFFHSVTHTHAHTHTYTQIHTHTQFSDIDMSLSLLYLSLLSAAVCLYISSVLVSFGATL